MPVERSREGEVPQQVRRPSAELEQARALTESVRSELQDLARERDAAIHALNHERARSRAREAQLRELLAPSDATDDQRIAEVDKKLHIALEELSVSHSNLAVANEKLLEANRQLEKRVAERTAELSESNERLERANAELSRRVDEETATRLATQQQLFQVQKLEAIGQLTGGIAHDFNNLLTVITGGLQLLARTTDETRRAGLIRRIEDAAWRGADVTRRLLAFASRQPLNPQPLALARHVEGLRELLRHGLREDIKIRVSVAEGLWPAEADLAALELALLNLAVNARDAMPNGGTMVLGARNVGRNSVLADQLGLNRRDYVELFVTDTGTGMTPEVLARVFEPFFTTKPSGKGTGLGLAQVYGFARQSGGAAKVESREGEGTTVSIMLPRSDRTPAPLPAEPQRQPPVPRRVPENLSVLLVEDDEKVAASVQELLEQLGHRPRRVSSLAAAVAVLSSGESVELIFTDVLLQGGGSGLDLAREVSRRNLNVPILLTSGYGGGMIGRLAAANLPFLRKPYTLAALESALSQAMATQASEFAG